MSDLLRVYVEAGEDGYPAEWHRCPTCGGSGWVCAATGAGVSGVCALGCGGSCPSSDGCPSCTARGAHGGAGSVKALVRAMSGDRCVRCHHPFVVGSTPGEWSRCDSRCTHGGEVRYRHGYEQRWIETDSWPDVSRQFDYDLTHTTVNPANRRQVLGPLEVEARWRVLTVHHLQTDSKLDCRWWNLAALCQRDHLYMQGKVIMDRPFILEHSDWFKPYAAGFYAWKYLGEDLTREETVGRLDELLALENPGATGAG